MTRETLEKILNYILIAGIFASGGLWLGIHLTQSDVINEMDRWHVARMYEDGSWTVEYKDGTTGSGCIETGLCQD